MIYELTPDRFALTEPLFKTMDYHLALSSIMAGLTPARVFVDDDTQASSVMVWAGHRHILAGAPDNNAFNTALAQFFEKEVIPFKLTHGLRWMSMYYAPDEWNKTIENDLLASRTLIPTSRQYYVYDTSENHLTPLQRQLPEGLQLRMVDAGLMEQTHLRNLANLREEMRSERPTVADFFDKSFGVCIVARDELAGWCLSEYNYADRCEIGIETGEAYRRQGFGTVMTHAMVERARAHGVRQVGWHCRTDNRPSAATALKAGFRYVCDYPAYVAGIAG